MAKKKQPEVSGSAKLTVTAPATERTTTRYPKDMEVSGGKSKPVKVKAGTVVSRPDYRALRTGHSSGRRKLRRKPLKGRSMAGRR